jgi:pimeloyl-ACP methyl ester carboxylesterase
VHLDKEIARMFAALTVPGLGPLLLRKRCLRLGPEGLVHESLRLCCVDPARIPKVAVQALVASCRERAGMSWANTAYVQAARSLVMLHTGERRRFLEQIRRVRVPTLLVQGAADRLAPLAAAQRVARMRPDWTFTVLDGVGHLPMLEDPERLRSIIDAWLEDVGPMPTEEIMPALPKRPALPAC